MIKYKQALALLAVLCSTTTEAQTNGSNSSYSRFGLGLLNEQTQGFSQAMGGVGIGISAGNNINRLNPASYAQIDSMSMIFDMGASYKLARFTQNGITTKYDNSTLDFLNAAFRIRKGLGMSIGFAPYSTIGYAFADKKQIGNNYITGSAIEETRTYSGDGGIHQLYMGAGWSPFKNFSIGANVSFLWGNYQHYTTQAFTEGGAVSSSYNGQNKQYEATLHTFNLDLGVQYALNLSPKDRLTLGLTYTLGHKINNTAHLNLFMTNGDTTHLSIPKAFELPHAFGAGISWRHNNQWLVAADVKHERWASCVLPQNFKRNGKDVFEAIEGMYQNRTRVGLGAEFTPDPLDRHYLQRIRYRIGASMSTPYVKVNQEDGPMTYGVSAGFGLPISNNINNRSVVNVSFQWERVNPSISSQITENYFKINVGITFNERWFMKWKID